MAKAKILIIGREPWDVRWPEQQALGEHLPHTSFEFVRHDGDDVGRCVTAAQQLGVRGVIAPPGFRYSKLAAALGKAVRANFLREGSQVLTWEL
jgi:hypothetical protein